MVIAHQDGNYEFRVYLPEARSVELVGTFTDWRSRAVAMNRESSGWWSVQVHLDAPNGRSVDHDFSYLVNHETWLPDYAASGVKRNSFGGWVSQLHVAPVEPAEVPPQDVKVRTGGRRRTAA